MGIDDTSTNGLASFTLRREQMTQLFNLIKHSGALQNFALSASLSHLLISQTTPFFPPWSYPWPLMEGAQGKELGPPAIWMEKKKCIVSKAVPNNGRVPLSESGSIVSQPCKSDVCDYEKRRSLEKLDDDDDDSEGMDFRQMIIHAGLLVQCSSYKLVP